jgi:hypothetical protein
LDSFSVGAGGVDCDVQDEADADAEADADDKAVADADNEDATAMAAADDVGGEVEADVGVDSAFSGRRTVNLHHDTKT